MRGILAALLLAAARFTVHHAFNAGRPRSTLSPIAKFGVESSFRSRDTQLRLHNPQNCDDDDDDDDDKDEDECMLPYGNRSPTWTSKYRSLLPYDKARASVMQLGLRSKEDWDEYVSDGKPYHGPYLPNNPEEMYALDWVSWEDFLCVTRSYNESKTLLRDVLKLQSEQEYTEFIFMDSHRAAGLRLPYKPAVVYQNRGWISWEDYLGLG
jgi:hypothetical protein